MEAPLLCYSQHGFGNLKRFLQGSKAQGEAPSSASLRSAPPSPFPGGREEEGSWGAGRRTSSTSPSR